jgi:hypothetical protein
MSTAEKRAHWGQLPSLRKASMSASTRHAGDEHPESRLSAYTQESGSPHTDSQSVTGQSLGPSLARNQQRP